MWQFVRLAAYWNRAGKRKADEGTVNKASKR